MRITQASQPLVSHLLMWSLCSALKLRYIGFYILYIFIGQDLYHGVLFLDQPSKGHKWPLFCIYKEIMQHVPHRHHYCFFNASFSLSPFLTINLHLVRGSRQQKIPHTCPGIPGMWSKFPNLLMFTFSKSKGVVLPCCSLSAAKHARMCP